MALIPIYMDCCPAESFNGAGKYPNSPFTAAACTFKASPEVEKEIHRLLSPKKKQKKKSVILRTLPFLREKIEAGEMGIFALCIPCAEGDAIDNGTFPFLRTEVREWIEFPGPRAMLNAADADAEKFAEEIGAKKKVVIRVMTLRILVYWCVVCFLRLLRDIHKVGTPDRMEMILDRMAGDEESVRVMHAIRARYRDFDEMVHNSFGTTVGMEYRAKNTTSCRIMLADLFASITTGITEGFCRPNADFTPPKKGKELPLYSDEEKIQLRQFAEFMMRRKILLHATPGMLEMMVGDAEKMQMIRRLQEECGLKYRDHIPPEFFQQDIHRLQLFGLAPSF